MQITRLILSVILLCMGPLQMSFTMDQTASRDLPPASLCNSTKLKGKPVDSKVRDPTPKKTLPLKQPQLELDSNPHTTDTTGNEPSDIANGNGGGHSDQSSFRFSKDDISLIAKYVDALPENEIVSNFEPEVVAELQEQRLVGKEIAKEFSNQWEGLDGADECEVRPTDAQASAKSAAVVFEVTEKLGESSCSPVIDPLGEGDFVCDSEGNLYISQDKVQNPGQSTSSCERKQDVSRENSVSSCR